MKRLVLIFAMLLILTGCNDRKKVDYNVETSDVSTEEAEERSEYLELAYEVVSGEGLTITVDAKVDLKKAEKTYPVIELQEKEIDSEELKNIVETVFDEGSTVVFSPYNYFDVDSWNNLKDKLEKLKEAEDDPAALEFFEVYLKEIQSFIDMGGNTHIDGVDEVLDEIKWYTFTVYDSEGAVVEEDEIYFCYVLGKIDGEYNFLRAEKVNGEYYITFENISEYYRPINAMEVYEDSVFVGEGNPCKYSKEEAIKLAEDAVSKLTDEEYGIIQVNNTCNRASQISNNEKDTFDPNNAGQGYTYGYAIYFGRQINGLCTGFDTNISNYGGGPLEGEVAIPRGADTIYVLVGDNGIIKILYNINTMLGETLSEDTELMDFETIDLLAREYMNNMWMEVEISDIELVYGVVVDDKKDMALIPMWVYYYDSRIDSATYYSKWPYITINAIDGTVY